MDLIKAVLNEDYDLCHSLILSGVNVNQASINSGSTPLWNASYQGLKKICQLLISSGANVNQATVKNGSTPLWIASNQGHIKICQLLIDSGADVNQVRTDNGETPLHSTFYFGRLKICQLLISSGANVNQPKINYGEPPLSTVHHEHKEIYQLLNNEIKRRKEVSVLLLLEKTFNLESLFHEENLPLDLFKLIWNESYLSLD